MNNIGILGGTFNPIHLGHTLPAKMVANYLSLDKVLFIPARIPPHKASPDVSAYCRAAMVKLACEDEPLFQCDERELKRKGYSYTVDTVQELSQVYPNARLHFIMGLDALLTFTQWHKYQDILSLCHLVVNTRPNYQLNTIDSLTKTLLNQHLIDDLTRLNTQKSGGIFLLPAQLPNTNNHANINLSSSEIRAQLTHQPKYQQRLDPKVLDFINKNKLYR